MRKCKGEAASLSAGADFASLPVTKYSTDTFRAFAILTAMSAGGIVFLALK